MAVENSHVEQTGRRLVLSTDIEAVDDVDDHLAISWLLSQLAIDPMVRRHIGLLGISAVPGNEAQYGAIGSYIETVGLSGVSIPPINDRGSRTSEVDFIVQNLMYQTNASIVSIGPLGNIAEAFKMEPKIASWTEAIWVMGGNFGRNYSPKPDKLEYNIRTDSEAARYIMNNPDVPVSMVPLDVTWGVYVSRDLVDVLNKEESGLAKVLSGAIEKWGETSSWAHLVGFKPTMHDVITVGEAIGKGLLEFTAGTVDVDEKGRTTLNEQDTSRSHRVATAWKDGRQEEFIRGVVQSIVDASRIGK